MSTAQQRLNLEANDRRIAGIEALFGNTGVRLKKDGRYLIGEGILMKMCRKKPKQRQFYLFNDILVYASFGIDKKHFNKQHIIPLEKVQLIDLKDEDNKKNGWVIRTPNKSFAVYAATNSEKNEWINHIYKCITYLQRECGKTLATDFAAEWIPDKEAIACMVCCKTVFGIIHRRHHCRACGKVVCSKCSNNTWHLPNISPKDVRVCDQCISLLRQGKKVVPYAHANHITSNENCQRNSHNIPIQSLNETTLSDSSDDEEDDSSANKIINSQTRMFNSNNPQDPFDDFTTNEPRNNSLF
uniref:FYVE-type domain-containing protein n=1 Tax=Parastrongyloides trichosuri TaxID=131310 RepID=A0A0N4Z048_PARTI